MPAISLKFTARNGRIHTLRRATLADDPGLLELERTVVRARHGVVKWEDELPADVAEYSRRRDSEKLYGDEAAGLFLVVEDETQAIVGEASLERMPFRMLRHVATLGISVHPKSQGLGVGRSLVQALLDWARTHRDDDGGRMTRVELFVRSDNARAIALYRSCGFELEGTRKAFHRRDDGMLIDDLMMAVHLRDETS